MQIFQFFKALRAVRIFKLAHYNAGMRKILQQTGKSLSAIVGFSSLLLLFIYIWALAGMELFAYRAVLDQDGNYIKPQEAKELMNSGIIKEF